MENFILNNYDKWIHFLISRICLTKNKSNVEAIKRFRDEANVLISYNQLKEIPLNNTVQINLEEEGAIECTRISSTSDDNLMFTVTMKKGQRWERHYHDCHETCVVYKGEIKDLISGVSATSAHPLYFKPYEQHYVIAVKDSVFYVEFKKPETKL